MKVQYVINGENFSTLEEFFEEVSRVLIPDATWAKNLDAFDDVLCGGFGTPENGFRIIWKNSDFSRRALGYPVTVEYIDEKLNTCHVSNIDFIRKDLENAKEGRGKTLFDMILEIIKDHGEGGDRNDGVELILE